MEIDKQKSSHKVVHTQRKSHPPNRYTARNWKPALKKSRQLTKNIGNNNQHIHGMDGMNRNEFKRDTGVRREKLKWCYKYDPRVCPLVV